MSDNNNNNKNNQSNHFFTDSITFSFVDVDNGNEAISASDPENYSKIQNILDEFNNFDNNTKNTHDIDYIPTDYQLNIFNGYDFDEKVSQTVDYNMNYNVKQLMLICDYYGLSKSLKNCKSNKEQIVDSLIDFEYGPENQEIVVKRKMMWYYIKELKTDNFMKKFIIWDNK